MFLSRLHTTQYNCILRVKVITDCIQLTLHSYRGLCAGQTWRNTLCWIDESQLKNFDGFVHRLDCLDLLCITCSSSPLIMFIKLLDSCYLREHHSFLHLQIVGSQSVFTDWNMNSLFKVLETICPRSLLSLIWLLDFVQSCQVHFQMYETLSVHEIITPIESSNVCDMTWACFSSILI